MAFREPTDEFFYGGAAGGGKSDLILGLAIEKHRRSMVFRREAKELERLIQRSKEIIPQHGDGWAGFFTGGDKNRWTLFPRGGGPQREIYFCGVKDEDDVEKWQGWDADFKGFDECTRFLERQVLRLTAWSRTTDPSQKITVALAGNPPVRPEGRWIVKRYAPWLDAKYTGRTALPEEARYFAMLSDKDVEVDGPGPIPYRGEVLVPRSRTFFPARVEDNPYYMATGYRQILLSQREPYRSQLLYGDFTAGMIDHAWQVLPTAWVMAAVDRWKQMLAEGRNKQMLCAVGVDQSRGGKDMTVVAPRFGVWVAPLQRREGASIRRGADVAGAVMTVLAGWSRRTPVFMDAVGIGAAGFDAMSAIWERTYGVSGSVAVRALDRTGTMSFRNTRSFLWWQMRELLDPDNPIPDSERPALPDDDDLVAQLCTPLYTIQAGGKVMVEEKESVNKRLGHSTDDADAVLLSFFPEEFISEARIRVQGSDGNLYFYDFVTDQYKSEREEWL